MRLAIITCMWKRHDIVEIAQRNLARIRDELAGSIDLRVVVVGSEGAASRAIVERHGAAYGEHDNRPLGAKFQRALTMAGMLCNPDGVIVEGSDNLINTALVTTWAKALDEGFDYCGLLDAYQYSPERKLFAHWDGYKGRREGEPAGAGRCYSRRLLNSIAGQLWDPTLEMSLDHSATCSIAPYAPRALLLRQDETDIRQLGVKPGESMCAMVADDPLDCALVGDWWGEAGAAVLGL